MSLPASNGGRRRAGYTLVELVTVCTVMLTLAAVALPTAAFTNKRIKEAELRSHLRTMRNAIDEHKRYSDVGLIPIEIGTDGYPSELDVLVEPIQLIGQAEGEIRFLRRIPVDPMTGEAEWGLRSYQDEPDDSNWGGENVYDVFSLSDGVGLDRVPYREW